MPTTRAASSPALLRRPDDWRALLAESTFRPADLPRRLGLDPAALDAVAARYPMRINPYVLGLVRTPADPLGRQVLPSPEELRDPRGVADPLGEDRQAPVPLVVHRYPDRVLFTVSNRCAVYCRFCLRKRQVGRAAPIAWQDLAPGLDYIRGQAAVREVILSGGDPLLRSDEQLAELLASLRAIPHVRLLRLHTRTPAVLPQRITPGLVRRLQGFQPLWINTHFNHPAEITPEAAAACGRLVDAGFPVGCQTVLLRGINDAPAVMGALLRRLVELRVRPYYLHHPDPVAGTAHFRLPLDRGLTLMEALRGHLSGLCLPQYVVDLPGGGGKLPLLPESILERGPGRLRVRNFQGQVYHLASE